MRKILASASAALLILAAPAANAQSEYSADDILEHFGTDESAGATEEGAMCGDQPCLSKGQTRAVCIGTASACASQPAPEPVADAGGFDLLITFDLGSDDLSEQARANLQEFARALADPALAGTQFKIEGHTDASGSAEFNEVLSQRRARSVVAFLTELGVDPSRLEAVGYGESAPREAGDPYAAINRRVEASLVR